MIPTFSIGEVCKNSWKRTKDQIWILAGLQIALAIISFLINLLSMSQSGSLLGQSLIGLLSGILGILFTMGYIRNCFQALDGYEPQFSAYGQEAHKILTVFLAGILSGLIVSIGICLLILPGIYLFLRLQFYYTFIIEEDAGIIDSLKKSWQITRGNVSKLLSLFGIEILIAIIGLLLFVVGIFVAMPYIYMIYCDTFRRLNVPVSVEEEVYEQKLSY